MKNHKHIYIRDDLIHILVTNDKELEVKLQKLVKSSTSPYVVRGLSDLNEFMIPLSTSLLSKLSLVRPVLSNERISIKYPITIHNSNITSTIIEPNSSLGSETFSYFNQGIKLFLYSHPSKSLLDESTRKRIIYIGHLPVSDLPPRLLQDLIRYSPFPKLISYEHIDGRIERPLNQSNGAHPNQPPLQDTGHVSYSMFLRQFQHSYAKSLRNKIDKLMVEFADCDWRKAVRNGSGRPQDTVISLYRYIEAEMVRLGLFDNSKSHAKDFPKLHEDILDQIRVHIEALIVTMLHKKSDIFSNDPITREDWIPAHPLHFETNHPSPLLDIVSEKYKLVEENRMTVSEYLRERLASLSFLRLQHFGDGSSEGIESVLTRGRADSVVTPSPSPSTPASEVASDRRADNRGRTSSSESPQTSRKKEVLEEVSGDEEGRGLRGRDQDMREAWMVAGQQLCRAVNASTPSEVMRELTITVKLVAAITQALLDQEDSRACSRPHTDHTFPGQRMPMNLRPGRWVSSSCVTQDEDGVSGPGTGSVPQSSTNQKLTSTTNCEILFEPIVHYPPGDKSEDKDADNAHQSEPGELAVSPENILPGVNADTLLPSVAWLILTTNPPNIDSKLWMTHAFRHPDVSRGEDEFCLTQVTSALQFCFQMSHTELEISEDEYLMGLLTHQYSKRLLEACSHGSIDDVYSCLFQNSVTSNVAQSDSRMSSSSSSIYNHSNEYIKHTVDLSIYNPYVDVNVLSADQTERPLTISIERGLHEITSLLLNHPNIDVNLPVCPHFDPPSKGSTHSVSGAASSSSESDGTPVNSIDWSKYLVTNSTSLMLTIKKASPKDFPDTLDDPTAVQSSWALQCVLQLLRLGAGRNVVDGNGKTALDYAVERRLNVVQDILEADPFRTNMMTYALGFDVNHMMALVLQGVDPNQSFVRIPEDSARIRRTKEEHPEENEKEKHPVESDRAIDSYVWDNLDWVVAGEPEYPLVAVLTQLGLCIRAEMTLPMIRVATNIKSAHNVNVNNERWEWTFLCSEIYVNTYLTSFVYNTIRTTRDLLENGADPNLSTDTNKSALLIAVRNFLDFSSAVCEHIKSCALDNNLHTSCSNSNSNSNKNNNNNNNKAIKPLSSQALKRPPEARDSDDDKDSFIVSLEDMLRTLVHLVLVVLAAGTDRQLPLAHTPLSAVCNYIEAFDKEYLSATTEGPEGGPDRIPGASMDGAELNSAFVAVKNRLFQLRRILTYDPSKLSIFRAIESDDIEAIQSLIEQGVDVNMRQTEEQGVHGSVAPVQSVDSAASDHSHGHISNSEPSLPNHRLEGRGGVPEGSRRPSVGKRMGHTPLIAAVLLGRVRPLYTLLRYTESATSMRPRDKTAGMSPPNSIITSSDPYNGLISQKSVLSDLYTGDAILDINHTDEEGNTALHYAVSTGNVDIVGILLRFQPDRTRLNKAGLSALNVANNLQYSEISLCIANDPTKVSLASAARHGDWGKAQALLRQGVSVNTNTKFETDKIQHPELECALIAAVAHGQLEFVRNILSPTVMSSFNTSHYGLPTAAREVDVNSVNSYGQHALMYAASRGDEAMILMLLKNGTNRYLKDNDGRDAAAWADMYGHKATVSLLRADPLKGYIHDAIIEGDYFATVGYLKQGVNPNQVRQRHFLSKGKNPISTASGKNKENSGKSLETGASATQETVSVLEVPLSLAAQHGRIQIMKLLLEQPDIAVNNTDSLESTPLFFAAYHGHEEAVICLLRHEADRTSTGLYKHPTNISNDYIRLSASEAARRNGFASIYEILVSDPAVVNLYDACESGLVSVVRALLKQGVDVSAHDPRPEKRLQTALMAACGTNRVDVVRVLVAHIPNHDEAARRSFLNDRDQDGRTALMVAAEHGWLELTSFLISHGANYQLIDNHLFSAQKYASQHGSMTGLRFRAQCFWA